MTDQNAPVRKHLQSAREHLAGVKAARAWHQELTAAHLLRSQEHQPHLPKPAQPPLEE